MHYRGKNHFPTVFKKIKKNKKKSDGKTRIFTQNQFLTKSIFLYGYNSKTNHCKYLKFSPHVYVTITEIFDFSQNFFSNKNISDGQKNLKIEYKIPYELFLLYLKKKSEKSKIIVQIFTKYVEITKICNFPSSSFKENSKHHNRKNFKCIVNTLKFHHCSYSDLNIIRIYKHNFFLLAFEVQILSKIRKNHEYLQNIFNKLITNFNQKF
ncbi:hypothetical protein AGLY_009810 [Aphis glycines]|uniref:Uncharacterized protein n=1 Tax=Aphis glycines TaxID=307491 RepID=A0A6G0THI2_APHGL|nr:hypothetical protein AGLY_009810 [Aphis glycines]